MYIESERSVRDIVRAKSLLKYSININNLYYIHYFLNKNIKYNIIYKAALYVKY